MASALLNRPTIGARPWVAAAAALAFGLGFYQYDDMCEAMPSDSALKEVLSALEIAIMGPGFGAVAWMLVRHLSISEHLTRRSIEVEKERRFQMLGRIAASVAHEVRNPLHNLRLIEEGLSDSSTDSALLERLRHNIRRLDSAVRLVHELSRRPPGEGRVDDGEAVAVPAAIEDAIGEACRRSGADPRRFRLARREALVAHGRLESLRIVLENLLLNAIEGASDGDVDIACSLERDQVVVAIANVAALPADFDGRSSSKPLGFGVGLSIAQHLASAMGGTLSLRQEGRHVVACLRLPAEKNA